MAVLEALGLAGESKLEAITCQQFSAGVLRPGTLSRPALMHAITAQRIAANPDAISFQSLPELEAFLAEVCVVPIAGSEFCCASKPRTLC